MKDILGVEIQVGDTIAYAAARNSAYLTVGRVVWIDEEQARVERIASSDYIVDGFYTKWEETQDGSYVTVVGTEKARATRVTMGDRVIVVKKGDV